jgi:hypothetical protein
MSKHKYSDVDLSFFFFFFFFFPILGSENLSQEFANNRFISYD